jgi:hypothetical protein
MEPPRSSWQELQETELLYRRRRRERTGLFPVDLAAAISKINSKEHPNMEVSSVPKHQTSDGSFEVNYYTIAVYRLPSFPRMAMSTRYPLARTFLKTHFDAFDCCSSFGTQVANTLLYLSVGTRSRFGSYGAQRKAVETSRVGSGRRSKW